MSFIYLSGPITKGGTVSYREQVKMVAEAEEYAYKLINECIPFILPHNNTYLWGYKFPDLKHEDYMRNDLIILKQAKAILMLPNWEDSMGAQEEHQFAWENKIPVFFWYELERLFNFYHGV